LKNDRVKKLNSYSILTDKKYILYWVHSSQRYKFNPSLNYSIELANSHKKPILAFFGLTESYPEANERHYKFMLEGLKELKSNLEKINIPFFVIRGNPCDICQKLSEKASAVVVDKAYLRIEKEWNNKLTDSLNCALYEVDNNLVVPIEISSRKEEYSAATLRRKITPLLDRYLADVQYKKLTAPSNNINIEGFELLHLGDPARIAKQLNVDHSVAPVEWIKGGESEARKMLDSFILKKLGKYSEKRSDPGLDWTSNMSPYLHFGHISPIQIALSVIGAKNKDNEKSVDAYLEELIVRRELAFNFVYYNENYDGYPGMTNSWAIESLEKHKSDKRGRLYSKEQLENAQTDDDYWNAAQIELLKTGKMHSYMRMYWCKKIIEWSPSPESAYDRSIYLNNKYSIDGRDPNSFAGVAWCFGKHDRAWKEREIFGKLRYMSYDGLKRKFHMAAYVKKQLKH
jgi:deoxyribodipyrimidine photo-lyase